MPLNQLEVSLHYKKNYSAFTLIELLVVMGILGVLMAVTLLVINPTEYLKRSRDTVRISDLNVIDKALALAAVNNGTFSAPGNPGEVYVSLPSNNSNCSDLSLPTGPTYHCVTQANLRKNDGNGWIPINLSTLLSKLPVDPSSIVATGLYYTYTPNGTAWQLTAVSESIKTIGQDGNHLIAAGSVTNTPDVLLTRGRPFKYVFVSSAYYTANLGGLSGADSLCQNLASNAHLPGIYKVWLSDSTTSASSRLTHSTLPYKRTDGILVANDWADLTNGSIANMININENGVSIDSATIVWTNTTWGGSVYSSTQSCLDWTSTSASYSGWVGRAGSVDDMWTSWTSTNSSGGCIPSMAFHLYCFEQ